MKTLVRVATLLFALLATATAARAHAVLVASDPAAGAQLERPPHAVTLTFDEGVETDVGSIRVLDAAGTVRSAGVVFHPQDDGSRVAVAVGPLERGRYVVAWRVVSADSHLVDGAFAFGVGVAAGAAPVLPPGNGSETLLPILHFLLLAGVLLAIGLPIGALAIAGRARTAPFGVEFGAWFVAAFAAFADIAFRADLAGGSLLTAFATRIGTLRGITIAAAFVGILALTGRRRRIVPLAVAAVATVVSLSLAGHAPDGPVPLAGVTADALHLLGAAAWIGVLAVGTTLAGRVELRAITPVATLAVAVIVITGTIQTLRDAGSLQALAGTAYGHLIDAKIALLLIVLAIAFTTRRALRRGSLAIAARIRAELWLLTAVVAVTAVLVESPLPRASAVPNAHAPAASATLPLNGSNVRVVIVAATRTAWTIRISGDAPLDAATVSVRETRRNVGPLDVTMKRTAPGSFEGTVTPPFTGEWTAYVSVRSGPFDEAHHTLPLPENQP